MIVVATHESGHVITGLACGLPVRLATIDPEVAGPGKGGCVWMSPDDPTCSPLKQFSAAPLFEMARPRADDLTAEERSCAAKLIVRLYARTVTLLAGTQAELLFHPDRTAMLATTDAAEAERLAHLVAGTSSATLLDHARADAARILVANRSRVEAVAAALLEYKTLDAEQIEDVVSSTPAMIAERARRRRWAAMSANAERFRMTTGGGVFAT